MTRIRYRQCGACPWRKDADRADIPGYCPAKHAALADTIAEPGALDAGGALPMMACHESAPGRETPCVGWLAQQLGAGNNIALRLWARLNLKRRLVTGGAQHECLEDTLPPSED